MKDTDFYIGYQSKAPAPLARFLRRVVGSLIVSGALLAIGLAALQRPFDPGIFEYGVVKDFEGVLLENPVPTLLVAVTAESEITRSGYSRFLLVAPGKFGAADLVAGLQGRTVRVQGSLIYRDNETMIELSPGSIREAAVSSDQQLPAPIDLGAHVVVGEIVDSKCYLGVMKPGREKTHRACAVRCISGGIPPILRITSAEDPPIHLLLLGEEGEPINEQILDFVAEPVEIPGTIRRLGDQLVFLMNPDSIRRLEG